MRKPQRKLKIGKYDTRSAEDIVFWSKGNYPTQLVNNITHQKVLEHLKLLYLLSDIVVGSASFYLESPLTRSITAQLTQLFESGEILYFVDDDLEGAEEHAQKKLEKTPDGMNAYKSKKEILQFGKEIDDIGNLAQRPNHSTSDKIVELWIADIFALTDISVGGYIDKHVFQKEKQDEIKTRLTELANNRSKDFVWEYIQPSLDDLRLDQNTQDFIRYRLTQLYALATAQILGLAIDDNIHSNDITVNSKFDTSLFQNCLEQIGVYESIVKLSPYDLQKLKQSSHFKIFKSVYFRLLDVFSYDVRKTRSGISVVQSIESKFGEISNKSKFLRTFNHTVTLDRNERRRFKNILDDIYDKLEQCGIKIVQDFKDTIPTATDINSIFIEINTAIYIDLQRYRNRAIKTCIVYVIFIFISIGLFAINYYYRESIPIVGSKKYIIPLLLFLIPFIRVYFKPDEIKSGLAFLVSSKERMRILAKLRDERMRDLRQN